jgi:hypothetical protein
MPRKRLDPIGALLADKISGESFLRRQRQQEDLAHEHQLADIRAGSRHDAPAVTVAEPPLHPFTRDGIKQAMFRVDQTHWPYITKMRVKKYYPLDAPVPPQLPEVLIGQIRWYASMLFKAEADQYEYLRSDARYPAWLSRLTDQVIAYVLTTLEKLEAADSDTLLMSYHGLTPPQIEQHLRAVLWEITHPYSGGIADPAVHAGAELSNPSTPAMRQAPETKVQSDQAKRVALRDAYRRAFHEAGIMDICWAAKQHYREWTRWLNGELKDGSKADRCFRALFASGKAPSDYRKQPRPKDFR